MAKYAICEIAGRQYMFEPGKIVSVDKLSIESNTLSIDKVLMMVDGESVELGSPYLSKPLEVEVVGHERGKKVRVAFYSSKANHRKVRGARREITKLRLKADAKKETKTAQVEEKPVEAPKAKS